MTYENSQSPGKVSITRKPLLEKLKESPFAWHLGILDLNFFQCLSNSLGLPQTLWLLRHSEEITFYVRVMACNSLLTQQLFKSFNHETTVYIIFIFLIRLLIEYLSVPFILKCPFSIDRDTSVTDPLKTRRKCIF